MSGNVSLSPAGRGAASVWVRCIAGFILAATALGCDERVVINAGSGDQGLAILLPGIDGRSGYSEAAARALCRGELNDLTVELQDWTSPLGGIFNQTAQGRNREVAAKIAGRIAEYRREHPGQPVFLIGHSGGTAMAVWAAEHMPEDEHVEGLILLASSLSPGYDLSTALEHSRCGIVNFYSANDAAILGAGTTIIGTMDGQHGESAGKAGFDESARPGYEKLFQIPWDPSMADAGNGGDHFGCMARQFVASYVGPLVRSRLWSPELIASVQAGTGEAMPAGETVAAGEAETGEPDLDAIISTNDLWPIEEYLCELYGIDFMMATEED